MKNTPAISRPESSGIPSLQATGAGHDLDVYHGRNVSLEVMSAMRQRVHWIVSQARGESILDVGTGAGIVPVLLARDGFRAVGIDIDPAAIAVAEETLAQEPESVRERVRFLNVSVFQDPSELLFDTVILGDVLQHVGNVRNVLRLAVGHLKPDGCLVVTVPFGDAAPGTTKHSFYLSDLMEHLAPLGGLEHLSVEQGHIRAVVACGQTDAATSHPPVAADQPLRHTEAALAQAQTALAALEQEAAGLRREAAQSQGRLRTAQDQLGALTGEVEETAQELGAARAAQQKAQAGLRAAEARLQDIEHQREAEQNALRNQSVEIRATKAQLAQVQADYDALKDRLPEVTAAQDAAEKARDAVQAALEQTRVQLAQETGRVQTARRECADLEADLDAVEAELRVLRKQQIQRDLDGASTPQDAVQETDDFLDLLAAFQSGADLPVAQMLQVCDAVAYENEGIAPRKVQMAQLVAQILDPDPARTRALGQSFLEQGNIAQAARLLTALEPHTARSSREARLWARLSAWKAAGGDVAAWQADTTPLTRSDLRVATVMDEFTYHSYAPECDLMQLSVDDWERELEEFAPEMLFIESAWRGKDEAWGSKVGHLSEELRGILAWCKARTIPAVFWNKEDPVHFETFLNTAAQFDAVFTTDLDRVAAYKEALGHDRVYFLPFAAQPDIHNPIEIFDRKDAFCFAGAYYKRYPDRIKDLESFVEALPEYRPLEIYDRNFGKDHPDYMFPDSYQPYIVGTLAPTEIDRAYKGYRFGINLNSIKDSQTMFARRVYELLASNTVTVSNFSRGVRQMFGDLVISTDSGAQALTRIEQIDAEMGARFQLAGLRKVLSEHTYSHRMSYITEKIGLPVQTTGLAPVVVLAAADTPETAQGLVAQFMRQTWTDATMVLVVPDAGDFDGVSDARVTVRMADSADVIADVVPAGARIAGMVAQDYYGPNYLTDLILSTRYTAAPVIGKAARHVVRDGERVVLENGEAAYRAAPDLPCRCSLIARTLLAQEPLSDWLADLPQATIVHTGCFAIDPYNYCRDGSDADPEQVQTVVDDVALEPGLPLPQVQGVAERMAVRVRNDRDVSFISGADLSASMVKPKTGAVDWQLGGSDWIMTSYLPSETHVYLYQDIDHRPADMMPDGTLKLHLETAPGLNLYWVVFFLDAEKKKISHQMVTANRDATFDLPEGTAWLRFGVRVYGPGYGAIKRLILGHQAPQPVRLLETRNHLVLTNHYPSHDDLYRNGFVHSRVKAYRARGVEMDVFRLRPAAPTRFHEFADVDVVTGSAEQLDDMLTHGSYESVNVHFLDADMWEVLARHIDRIRVNVWVHGSEVQPWWRREYNYVDDPAGLETAKAESDARLAFWRDVLTPMPDNLHLVFVSEYFAEEVMEDLGLRCREDKYSIIHNPIDTNIFRYVPKRPDQRLKILSIRPFASAKYANDLSVKALLMLREKAFFGELDIRIIGDGKLFDEILAPLQGLSNIQIERRFLSQPEIASLHRQYGVFLNPTRMDAQGVSRDEAMSSGLVPVTTAVAAIPEFVDANSGYLAEPEDAAGLAAAIEDMYCNPDKFLVLSQAAAARVRGQSGADIIIAAELDLISNGTVSPKRQKHHEPD